MAIETIMLNTPTPIGTPAFSIETLSLAAWDPTLDCWRITVPGDCMIFNLNLSGYSNLSYLGITLVLTLYSLDEPGESFGPLSVTVNQQSIVSNWDSQEDNFYVVSWAIPPEAYGNNLEIELTLGSSANTSLAIREVTCLVFQMQPQEQTQWCWLAVATSMALFYNANSPWTQCLLANQQLKLNTCCPPGNSQCNVTGDADVALSATGNLANRIFGTITASDIQEQINAGQPIGIDIQWPDGTGHVIVALGVSPDLLMVLVTDPWEEEEYLTTCDILYTELVNAYKGAGRWTDTYLTQV